jgi:hypothetical protein
MASQLAYFAEEAFDPWLMRHPKPAAPRMPVPAIVTAESVSGGT